MTAIYLFMNLHENINWVESDEEHFSENQISIYHFWDNQLERDFQISKHHLISQTEIQN